MSNKQTERTRRYIKNNQIKRLAINAKPDEYDLIVNNAK